MIVWALVWAAAATQAPDYRWPLDLPPIVTSSFGEHRSGRLHTGIDLRARDIGALIKAPGDGYVARVRCSPYGYGKAVYLQLDDGFMAVFGHLSDFMPDLGAYVRAEQHRREQYTVDVNPPPDRFRVRRGDIVAYSGDTGAGPAHLHYELRDKSECALNPRAFGIEWPDATPPVIRHIAVYPATPESRVENGCLPVVREAKRSEDGVYVCDAVQVFGQVMFGVDVIDPANNGENVLGVHTAILRADGRDVFTIRNDRISYARLDHGAACYDRRLNPTAPFLLLWRWPNNRSETIAAHSGDGRIAAPREMSEVRIVAEDFFGHRAEAIVPLTPETADASSPEGEARKESAALKTQTPRLFSSEEWNRREDADPIVLERRAMPGWIALGIRHAGFPDADPPLLLSTPSDGASMRAQTFRCVSPGVQQAAYALPRETTSVTLRIVWPRRAEAIEDRYAVFTRGAAARTESWGDVRLEVPSNGPFDTLCVVHSAPTGAPVPPARMLGDPFRLDAGDAPIDAPLTVSTTIPPHAEKPARVHLYRASEKGWSRLDTEQRGGRLVCKVRELGVFAAMEDVEPPVIEWIESTPGGLEAWPRPVMRLRVADAASGIADIRATCRGRWLLMDYDPEKDLLVWARDEDLAGPPARIEVVVADHAGNTAFLHQEICEAAPSCPSQSQ
ncbi:MAG TPA: M23 family metallopeptidase [Candidatus Hydrogenedentes bacterium]|nr:M23 family metallopeptidase [Candidatus Hydrogenedentota bacterium]